MYYRILERSGHWCISDKEIDHKLCNNSVLLKGVQIISVFFTMNFLDGSYSQVFTLDFMALIHLDIGKVILIMIKMKLNFMHYFMFKLLSGSKVIDKHNRIE